MIERCREAYPVRMMCRLLGVSPSGFYDATGRVPSSRDRDNARLLEEVRQLHAESDGVRGSPRITDELRYRGETCGRNRIARLMRLNGLRGIPQRRQWRSKPSTARPAEVTNQLERDFTADAPNRKWVTDITYIRTAERWLYLCVVVDLYGGRVVGWSMSHRQERQLVLQAVLMALWQRDDRHPVILHSDRGCQFTSDEYQRFLKGHNLVCSMSAVGSCADNAPAEGFFGMLKRERVNRRCYQSHAEARADVFDYIERFYNPARERRLAVLEAAKRPLTNLSVETG
jgi:putative transposase